MSEQKDAPRHGKKNHARGRFPERKDPEIEVIGPIAAFPPPPDFMNTVSSSLGSPDFNIGGEELILLAFPDFSDQTLEFPPVPDFHVGPEVSVVPNVTSTKLAFPLPPDFTSLEESPLSGIGPGQSACSHATQSAFPLPPDFTSEEVSRIESVFAHTTQSAFPPLPDLKFPPLPDFNTTDSNRAFPPVPDFVASSDFPPIPTFPDMEVDSGEQQTTFPSLPDLTTVGSSFPPIPNFHTSISIPKSGPRLTDLNRDDTPILPDPAALITPKKRGRSQTVTLPPHKPKKSKTSVQLANLKAAQRNNLIENEQLCRNYRRLGDEREVDSMYIQPSIGELYAAHYAIRPAEGARLPYHIGYARALEEAEREIARLEDLEATAEEAVDRLTTMQNTMEQWYSAWGL